MADRTARLARRIGAARKALGRGERPDVGQLRDLVRAIESHLRAAPEQADVPRQLALLDEAAALFRLLAREREEARQAIEADSRRRLGRVAYRPSRQG